MLLALALQEAPAQLDADLREYYALDWEQVRHGQMSVARIASLVEQLPRGARIWLVLGGPMAVTPETQALMQLEHTMVGIAWAQGGKKGSEPKMRDWPKSLRDRRAELEKASVDHVAVNYAAWKRRAEQRQQRLAKPDLKKTE